MTHATMCMHPCKKKHVCVRSSVKPKPTCMVKSCKVSSHISIVANLDRRVRGGCRRLVCGQCLYRRKATANMTDLVATTILSDVYIQVLSGGISCANNGISPPEINDEVPSYSLGISVGASFCPKRSSTSDGMHIGQR